MSVCITNNSTELPTPNDFANLREILKGMNNICNLFSKFRSSSHVKRHCNHLIANWVSLLNNACEIVMGDKSVGGARQLNSYSTESRTGTPEINGLVNIRIPLPSMNALMNSHPIFIIKKLVIWTNLSLIDYLFFAVPASTKKCLYVCINNIHKFLAYLIKLEYLSLLEYFFLHFSGKGTNSTQNSRLLHPLNNYLFIIHCNYAVFISIKIIFDD